MRRSELLLRSIERRKLKAGMKECDTWARLATPARKRRSRLAKRKAPAGQNVRPVSRASLPTRIVRHPAEHHKPRPCRLQRQKPPATVAPHRTGPPCPRTD